MDRTIRDAVNHRTAAYNAGILSGNMSEYKASCYALRRAVRAAKLRYRERIESHFQLNDSRRMWQGLKTICSSVNNSSAEVRADPLLAEELNTFYGCFECNGGSVTLKKKKKEKVFNLFFFSLETTIELSIYPVSVSELAYELSPSSVVTREDTDELSVFPASVPHMLSLFLVSQFSLGPSLYQGSQFRLLHPGGLLLRLLLPGGIQFRLLSPGGLQFRLLSPGGLQFH